MKQNLVNAAKYVCIMIFSGLFVLYKELRTDWALVVYVTFGVCTSIYCMVWDFYIDWGLFRSTEPGKQFLRPKLLLPKWFYYHGIVTNTILRLFWIIQILPLTGWAADPQFMYFLLGFAEGLRRT